MVSICEYINAKIEVLYTVTSCTLLLLMTAHAQGRQPEWGVGGCPVFWHSRVKHVIVPVTLCVHLHWPLPSHTVHYNVYFVMHYCTHVAYTQDQ